MGNSRYNKIYLGRRAMLLNMRRVQVAASLSALAIIGAFWFLITK